MPQLNAALVPTPDQVVVRFVGDADLSTAPLLADTLATAARLNTGQVVVDVAATRFWDCSGLHALADFTQVLAAAGRACRIVGALPATRRLIAMANLAGRLQLDGVPAAGLPAAPAGDVRVPAHRQVGEHPLPLWGGLAASGCGR